MAAHRFCGDRLEEKRKDLGLTQEQLSKMIGVNEKTISSYERGEIAPRVKKLILIAETLDVLPDYLLGFTDTEMPANQKNYLPISRSYPPEMKKDLKDYLEFLKFKYNQK